MTFLDSKGNQYGLLIDICMICIFTLCILCICGDKDLIDYESRDYIVEYKFRELIKNYAFFKIPHKKTKFLYEQIFDKLF